jgi:ATP-binding cassette subfamily F protein 3
VGLNGAGKSTLLKALGQQMPLLAGELKFGFNVTLAFFSQHSAEQLNPNWTVLEALNYGAHSTVKQQEVLNIAGSLLFAGDAVQKKVRVLSGGEKSRVALGQILLKKAPLLLLDEPTNHLDFDTVEALTEALARYEGSIITVSHDRAFIGRVANQILEVRNGGLLLYPGTYDEYVWSLQKGYLATIGNTVNSTDSKGVKGSDPVNNEASKLNYKEQRKRLDTSIKKIQKEIADLEKKLVELAKRQTGMTEQLITMTGPQAKDLSKNLHAISGEIMGIEETILNLMEELDQAQKQSTLLQSR